VGEEARLKEHGLVTGQRSPEMRRTSERVTGDVDMWYVSEHGGKNPGTRCMGERVTKDFDMYVIEQEGKNPET
jgi:hypothetical protein